MAPWQPAGANFGCHAFQEGYEALFELRTSPRALTPNPLLKGVEREYSGIQYG